MEAGPELDTGHRPRLLLVPQLTELEWVIRPLIEEWAEVASYDAPGIGEEPAADALSSEVIGARGLAELERRGWPSCVLVMDEFGAAAGTWIASRRPDAVQGVAFGHARLSNSFEGDNAPFNSEVFAALASLVRTDPRTFVRQLFMLTHGEQQQGGYGEELVESYMSRVPVEALEHFWVTRPDEGEEIGHALAGLDTPILLARHDGCLLFTAEGYEAAEAALSGARSMSFAAKPSASPEFAEALREFCLDLQPERTESHL